MLAGECSKPITSSEPRVDSVRKMYHQISQMTSYSGGKMFMENRGFFSKMAENKITSETFQKLLNFCSSHHNIYDAYLINIYKLTKFHVLTSFLVNRGGGNCQKNTQKHDFYNKFLKLSIIFLTNTSIYHSKLLLHMFLFIVY